MTRNHVRGTCVESGRIPIQLETMNDSHITLDAVKKCHKNYADVLLLFDRDRDILTKFVLFILYLFVEETKYEKSLQMDWDRSWLAGWTDLDSRRGIIPAGQCSFQQKL